MKRLIFIIGTTASGKSKLALHLAQKFKTEIISADSMQVYQKLDIASAKIQEEDRKKIKHHLISVTPIDQNFSINDFEKQSQEIINSLNSNSKPVIIAGGTFYYCESLIYKNYLNKKDKNVTLSDLKMMIGDKDINYKRLCEIDPIMAKKLHPNDERKVADCLSYYDSFGQKRSDFFIQKGNNILANDIQCIMLFLNCEKSILISRIRKRVDEMIKTGLIQEIHEIWKCVQSKKSNINQAIGMKQLAPFFEKLLEIYIAQGSNKENDFLNFEFGELCNWLEEDISTFNDLEKIKKLTEKNHCYKPLVEGIERMKLDTKKYAKKQLKWIKNRFLVKKELKIFEFDTSNEDLWEEEVTSPAIKIVEEFVMNGDVSETPRRIKTRQKANSLKLTSLENWENHFCSLCGIQSDDLMSHLNGRKHKRKLNQK